MRRRLVTARLGDLGLTMMRQSETLARFALFRSLGPELIHRLDSQCIWKRAKANEWVLNYEGDSVDLFFVAYGRLRVTIRPVSGGEIILRDLIDGEFFGELAALDGRPRSAGVLAMTDSVVARMTPAVFRETVHSYPDVCDQLLALLATQVRTLANRVRELSTFDVRHRIYSELLRLSRAEPDGEEMKITPPPTHAELAARTGTHREAVTRELKRLERDGLLERRRGAIVLLKPSELMARIERASPAV
jgi:CRP/FNR family transcriptional regulator, cyclic AMP receptor protein